VARYRNKQLSIYPDDDARRIVGGNIPACNRAIACWAIALRQAQPDLARGEWNMLADVLNGSFEGDLGLGMYEHGPSSLALEVHDAQALNGTGDKWLGDGETPGSGQAAADALEAKITAMTWMQVQAIRTACLFFWDDAQPGRHLIEHQTDEWWTIRYRLDYLRRLEGGDQ